MSQTDTKDDLPKLAEQARQAYEQKRIKDCLDLTRAILLIEPDNTTANSMRSSIQSEMQRDLENARAFLREALSKEKAENEPESSPPPVSITALPKSTPAPAVRPNWWESFKTHRLVRASVLIVIGLIVASLLRFKPNPARGDALRTPTVSDLSKPIDRVNVETPAPLLVAASGEVLLASAPQPAAVAKEPSSIVDPPPAHPVTKLPDQPVTPQANGTLAVSSPTAIDIYKDGTYIGSAPVSFELSPGAQTLEYRHGSLSRKITHLIASNETTRATITFDVDVQINSRPWAEVFLDGVERKALGQTPLSGVRVPIGSVLVFENPGFAKKKYRVTGNEAGIQIVFP